jgi:chromate transporter
MIQSPTLFECAKVWANIGIFSFGGPAGQIALMERTLVAERGWIKPDLFSNGLNFCMLLPGPEAQQLATYCGWLLHGRIGAWLAGLLFILPGALIMLGLSFLYVTVGQTSVADGILLGIKAVVLVVVIEALLRIAKRALKRTSDYGIAIFAFIALAVFQITFPLIIIIAAVFGVWRARSIRADITTAPLPTGHISRLIRIFVSGMIIWLAPLACTFFIFGPESLFTTLSLFFSKMAVVTFGGAYAILSYVAQQAVETFHWVSPAQMADGLGLAETTPGPLILVTQHIGFLAAWQTPGQFSPTHAAILGASLTTWATFVPSFILILMGAPYVGQLSERPKISAALSAITAAVLGVIANMALWFSIHVLFAEVAKIPWALGKIEWPIYSSFQALPLGIAVAAAILTFKYHMSTPFVVICGGVIGFVAIHTS